MVESAWKFVKSKVGIEILSFPRKFDLREILGMMEEYSREENRELQAENKDLKVKLEDSSKEWWAIEKSYLNDELTKSQEEVKALKEVAKAKDKVLGNMLSFAHEALKLEKDIMKLTPTEPNSEPKRTE